MRNKTSHNQQEVAWKNMINILFKIILCYLDISTLWRKSSSIPSAKHQKPVLTLCISQDFKGQDSKAAMPISGCSSSAGPLSRLHDQQNLGATPPPSKSWVFSFPICSSCSAPVMQTEQPWAELLMVFPGQPNPTICIGHDKMWPVASAAAVS